MPHAEGPPRVRSVIDLDSTAPPARVRSPGRRPLSVPLGGVTRRGWAALVVLAVIVAGGFWLVQLQATALDRLATLPEGTMRVVADADRLYLLQGDTTAPWTISAYDWAHGRQQWRLPLSGTDGNVFVIDGWVLTVHQPCNAWHPSSIDRLDPRSGQSRWRSGTALLGTLRPNADTAVALLVGWPGDGDCTVSHRVAELAALDLETGSPRWTLDAGPGGFLAVAEPESPWFAIWSADGNVRGYDGGSGAALATAVIPAVGQAPPGGVRTVGAVLLVVTPAADGAALTAYRRQDLQVLWRRPLAAGETAPLAQMAYLPPVTGCGPMACVPSASGFTVVDPATGRTRWRHATVSNAVYGAGVLVGDGGDGVVVLDWPTGRQIGARPGWRVVPTFDGSTASGAALIQRSSGSGAEPRTVDLRTVDLRTGAERAIGAVTPAPTRCVLARQRLACAAGDGSVRLWRIRG